VIFVTTAKSKCFGCGKSGHLIRNCPDKLKENEVYNENNIDVVPGTSETPEAVLLNCEAPGVSRAEPESVVTGKDPPGEGLDAAGFAEAGSSSTNQEQTGMFCDVTNTCNDGKAIGVQFSGNTEEKLSCGGTETLPLLRGVGEEDCGTEMEQTMFKVPQKRKKSGQLQGEKACKKSDVQGNEDQETESDSESSDSSIVLSQSDFSGRSYDNEDIKMFLKATKNKRGVCVQEYFPDIKQFIEKTRSLMAEGCFNNREVYRLKKIVRLLDKELSNNDV